MKRLMYAALLLLLLVILGVPAIIALMAAADAPPKTTLPNPNGHDTLWKAAQKLAPLPEDFFTTEDLEALQSSLVANSEALALIDEACGEQIVVPIAEVDLESQQWIDQISSFRNLLRLMQVQARVAELEDRPADAAMVYVKMFDLSNRTDDGGLLVHSLTSIAGKRMALTPLMVLVEKLPEESRAEIADRLKEAGNDRIAIDAVMKRERAVIRRQYGMFRAGIMNLTNSPETTGVTQRDQEMADQYDRLIRELSRDTDTDGDAKQ